MYYWTLLPLNALLLTLWFQTKHEDVRLSIAKAVTVLWLQILIITEALSFFGLFSFPLVLISWVMSTGGIAIGVCLKKKPRFRHKVKISIPRFPPR